MFRRYSRLLALCAIILSAPTLSQAQTSLFTFDAQVQSCTGPSGATTYTATVGNVTGSQLDYYLQPGTGWELHALLVPETWLGHDLAELYQTQFNELPRTRLVHGTGTLPITDPNGTVIAFELTYNPALFGNNRAQISHDPTKSTAQLITVPKTQGKVLPTRDRNRTLAHRGRALFDSLYAQSGSGTSPRDSLLGAYGLSSVTRASLCSYPPLSSLTRIAIIGGTIGDRSANSSVELMRNKTATVPLTPAQASAIQQGASKLLVVDPSTTWADVPQVDPVLYYANGTPRLVRLTFTDRIVGVNINPYAERHVYIGPSSQISGRDAAGLSNQLQAILAAGPVISVEADGPRTGEKYVATFNISSMMPREVVSFGSHRGTFRFAQNLLPAGSMTDHLPQAGQAQLFFTSDFGELNTLRLSLDFVNSIASDNGRGFDNLYLRNLRLCARHASSFAAWNPYIDTLNRNLYLYGEPLQLGDRLCLPLLPETGNAHLFRAGQVTPFLDIVVGYSPTSGRASHLASGATKYVTLNNTGSENSFYNQSYLFNAGIPDAIRGGKTAADMDYEAGRIFYHDRPFVNSSNQCIGGICNLHPQFYSVISGPPDGNTTGGGDIDFAKADATILHNARGSSAIGKALDAVVIHAIAQLQREYADGLVTMQGDINTLDRMIATYSHFKYHVAPVVHATSSWHPRFNGTHPVASVLATYLNHQAAGQALGVPYANSLNEFSEHNNQHIIRMATDVLAAGVSSGDPAILFYNEALGETLLTAHYWNEQWYPANSFRLERNLAVAYPGTGTNFGRNMEVLPLIAEAAVRKAQIPSRFINEFISLYAETLDAAPSIGGLFSSADGFDIRIGYTTAQVEGFKDALAQRCGLNRPTTDVAQVTNTWQQFLLTLSTAHVVDRFKDHPLVSVRSSLSTIEAALVQGMLAQHDSTVGFKSGFPVWSVMTEVRDTSTNISCRSLPSEQLAFAHIYTPIGMYWRQAIAPYLVAYPQIRQTVLNAIPTSYVQGGTLNLEDSHSLLDTWAGQVLGR